MNGEHSNTPAPLSTEPASAPRLPVMPNEPNVVQTRRGWVRVIHEPIPRDHHRSWVIVEGPREAVMCEVVRKMEGCTQCYEHMFSIYSIEQFSNGHIWRARCINNTYAGD